MTRWMFPHRFHVTGGAVVGCPQHLASICRSAATPVLLNLADDFAAWLGANKSKGIEPVYALAVGVMVGGVLQLAVQVLRCPTGFAAQYPPWPGQHAGARQTLPLATSPS
jgi:putative peptidoglycan lipid II flippase